MRSAIRGTDVTYVRRDTLLIDKSVEWLKHAKIWHATSANEPVRSCADAAARRRRLGSVGIPLCDELKSLLCAYSVGTRRLYAMLHCRGHQRFDLAKASAIVGEVLTPISATELAMVFSAEYGTVTPMVFLEHSHVRQFVDDTVVRPFYPPYTTMTNLGDLRHAVEFNSEDLFSATPDTAVADIVTTETKRTPRQVLGILTGSPPESGILLWQKVKERIRSDAGVRFRGTESYPRVVVESVPGLNTGGEPARRTRPQTLRAVERLCESGATLIGVAADVPAMIEWEIASVCEAGGSELVRTAEETGTYLRSHGIHRFKFVGDWTGYKVALRGLDAQLPSDQELRTVNELKRLVDKQMVTGATINRLRDWLRDYVDTDTVVVAVSEIAVILNSQVQRQRSSKRFIDTLDVIADTMASAYTNERTATGGY